MGNLCLAFIGALYGFSLVTGNARVSSLSYLEMVDV